MLYNIYAGNLKLHVKFGKMKHREERLHFYWASAGCSVWHGTTSAPTRTWEQQFLSCHCWEIWNFPLDIYKKWAVISSQPSPSSLPFARLFYVKKSNVVSQLDPSVCLPLTERRASADFDMLLFSLIVFWREQSGIYYNDLFSYNHAPVSPNRS